MVWAILGPLLCAIVIGTIDSFNGGAGLIVGFFALLLAAIWFIDMLRRIIKAAKQRLAMRCAYLLAVLILAMPAAAVVSVASTDYVHFALAYPYYLMQLNATAKTSSNPVDFTWSGGFGSLKTIVYDPTDATAAKIGLVRPANERCWTNFRHMLGHFYLMEDFCDG